MNKINTKIAYSLTGITTILAFVFYFLAKKLCMYVDDIIIVQNVLSLIVILISIFLIYKYYDDEYKKYIIVAIAIYLITSFIRIAFMIYNDPSVMHDAYGTSPTDTGHLGYILYIYENKTLPSTSGGVLYHPPLYYILSSLFINIAKVFHFTDYKDIVFADKIFSFIIVNLSILLIYKILCQLDLDKKIKFLIFYIISAHPIFMRFSGFINNDVLATFFYILSIYYLILWWKNTDTFNTLFLGVSVALGTLTKSNSLTFIVFMFMIFVIKLYDRYKKGEKNVGVVLKIGLSLLISILPILMYKYFKVSQGNAFSEYKLFAFLDIKKIITYLVGLDRNSFTSIYYGDLGTVQGSILPYLFKTEVFMEYTIYNMPLMPYILFFSNLMLTIYSVIIAIKKFFEYIFSRDRIFYDLFFFILYIILFGSIFYFSLLDSRTCTPAFRYIVPIIIPKCYFIVRDINNNRLLSKLIKAIIILFIFSSIFIFMKLDMIQDVALYRTAL